MKTYINLFASLLFILICNLSIAQSTNNTAEEQSVLTASQMLGGGGCVIATPTITMSGYPCPGTSVQLIAPTGYTSYDWSNGSDFWSTSITDSGIYQLIVTDEDCSDTVNYEVNFAPLPAPEITQIGNACPGQTLTLEASAGYESYNWNVVQNTQSIELNGYGIYGSGTYTVNVQSGNCSGSSSVEIQFAATEPPYLVTTGGICDENTLITQCGNCFPPFAQVDSLVWNTGATTSAIPITESGLYYLTTYFEQCVYVVYENYIELPDDSLAEIIISGDPCMDEQVILTAANNGLQYQWSNGATTQSIVVNEPGVYVLSIVDSLTGCTISSEITISYINGFGELGCNDVNACNYNAFSCGGGECVYPEIPGDVDCSGLVTVTDVIAFLSYFGCIEYCEPFDLDDDGIVGVTDFIILLGSVQ